MDTGMLIALAVIVTLAVACAWLWYDRRDYIQMCHVANEAAVAATQRAQLQTNEALHWEWVCQQDRIEMDGLRKQVADLEAIRRKDDEAYDSLRAELFDAQTRIVSYETDT